MNRKLTLTFLIAAFIVATGANAQIKVGTPAGAPNSGAILDASNTGATATSYKGMYLPQVALTGNNVYGLNTAGSAVAVNGMIVYNTATAGAGATAVTPGIYVWNSNVWNKVNTSSANGNDKNIYEGNGTLVGNRNVSQAGFNLGFTGGNVGIGTAGPLAKLHVEGNQYINAAPTIATTKDALKINVGQDGFGYGSRTDNFGILMTTNTSNGQGGSIARINFGDVSTGTATGPRYLSFSVGKTLNELMYLTNASSGTGQPAVGIGTTTPLGLLSNNSANLMGGDAQALSPASFNWQTSAVGYAGAIYNASTSGAANGLAIKVASNLATATALDVSSGTVAGTQGTSLFMVKANGNIGVGQTNPQYPLHVTRATGTHAATAKITAVSPTTAWTLTNSASLNVAIFAEGVIGCESGLVVHSDARIKNIKGISDNNKDLSTLKNIEITDYKKIDTLDDNRAYKKVIAQQVESIFPQAVMNTTGFIPNVFEMASKLSTVDSTTVIMTKKAHDFKTGDLVRLETDVIKEEIVTVIDNHTFSIHNDLKTDKVFVYGKKVGDLKAVDYEAIAMLNVSATQELAKQIDQTKTEIEVLRAQNVKLAAQNAKLNEQVTKLNTQNAEVAEMKVMMAQMRGELGKVTASNTEIKSIASVNQEK